jgi:hypothetical protein
MCSVIEADISEVDQPTGLKRPRYNMAINIKRYIQNKTKSVILSTGGRNVI